MRRVIVTGSRDWSDSQVLHQALAEELSERGPFILVHGKCPKGGADLIADRWARNQGLEVDPMPADWEKYGDAAGPIRNAAMVAKGADRCLAFPIGRSKGTRGCAKLAKAAGIPVEWFDA